MLRKLDRMLDFWEKSHAYVWGRQTGKTYLVRGFGRGGIAVEIGRIGR